MGFDLLSSTNRFPRLNIYVDERYPLSDEEFQTEYGISPIRKSFFKIPWEKKHLVFIMRPEEFSQSTLLLEKNDSLFLLSFDEVDEKYRFKVCAVDKKPTDLWAKLDFIEHLIHEDAKLKLQVSAQDNCSNLFKEATRLLSDKSLEAQEQVSNILSIFLSFDSTLLEVPKLEEFISLAAQNFEALNLWDRLELASIDEIVGHMEEEERGQIFPLDWLGLDHYLYYIPKKEGLRSLSFVITLLLEWLEKFVAFHPQLSLMDAQTSLWEEALAKISLPLALINVKGDLVVYNQSFTKLNISPRDCLNLGEEENIEVEGDFYRVKKVEIERDDVDTFLILFYNQNLINAEQSEEQNIKSISSQELGIISGSIAHELNNPLAGILAAIGLLELEDWDEDETEALHDMKTSAKRCKSLVEIFLGFSRTRDQQQKEGPIRNALGQALDLLRFRMIESDVRIEVEIESSTEVFKRYVNLSLGSMILYLVLGEVLTLFNHYRLVLGDQSLKVLKANYKEEKDRIVISFSRDFEIDSKPLKSKLIEYLVEVQGLEIDTDQNKIILSDWKLI